MSDAVRVLIINEPSDLGAAFRATLEHTPALRTVGEEELREPGAPCVVLAFAPEYDPAAVAALRERAPDARILVAFQAADAAEIGRFASAGADAFVARCAAPRDICTTILALAHDLPLHEGEAEAPAPEAAAESLGLTPREAEVLRFLSAGFSNKEVARRLTVSVRTVETHRLNLRRKTKTGRLKDLVQLARQIGLAPVLEGEARPLRRINHGAHRIASH
ncbi:response regulator transcription factor [Methylobacterium frigidaeris]|uniref:HTH-type transcriptional regulator MalT n=1 Tax=Methylobacterium frigidaeris TaxID=2038277 RepID=A0AA37HCW7_9HYPH|nr:LuxR C-terminal-related transcriptional regulator [Methylobacterium frigidaeris]PIK69231.1 helix-turn-helix transcriptional regulator [Methylobacterium frigidaeris]GJD63631.1 HTH-type transcriptional regulator MalT [Methylobacterium frigidaeris]